MIKKIKKKDATIFLKNCNFFCPWKHEKTPSKVSHNRPKISFQYCQPVQNQPKFHILFHKIGFLRNFYIMTLWVSNHNKKYNVERTFQIDCRSYLLDVLLVHHKTNLMKRSVTAQNEVNITSVSKKPGQTTVVIQYYSLSRFFWNRRYFYSYFYMSWAFYWLGSIHIWRQMFLVFLTYLPTLIRYFTT